jgi:tetratricopeptide (TPR) repeat protein
LLREAYSQGGIEAAMNRYDQIASSNRHNEYYYSAGTLNQIGYDLLSADRIEDALRVFQLNAKEYPEDWNSFDSYGDALMTAGRKDMAIGQFERARALDPSQEHPRSMLRDLHGR